MDPGGGADVQRRESEEPVHSEVVFKKRVRPSRTRKRTRSTLADEEDPKPLRLPVPLETERKQKPNELKPKTQKRWKREEYGASGAPWNAKIEATAERKDVGGENVQSSKPKKPFGPLSAPSHLRTSVRMDYQPDVCKDYKETGYCGFGDACKFLHDRSDYKAGWQLDRDWAANEKMRREKVLRGENPDQGRNDLQKNDDVDDDGLPFACFLCRGDFKRPIMTLCSHYFCEECALKRLERHSTCAICKKQLRGTLNPAPKLVAKLREQRIE